MVAGFLQVKDRERVILGKRIDGAVVVEALQYILIVGTRDAVVIVTDADRCADREDSIFLRKCHELAQRAEVLHGVRAFFRRNYALVRNELLTGDLAGDAVLITCVVVGLSVRGHDVARVVDIDLAVRCFSDDINALVDFHGQRVGGFQVSNGIAVFFRRSDLRSEEYDRDLITGKQKVRKLSRICHCVGAVRNEHTSVAALVQFIFHGIEKHLVHRRGEVFGADVYRLDDREILAELAGGIEDSVRSRAELECFFR